MRPDKEKATPRGIYPGQQLRPLPERAVVSPRFYHEYLEAARRDLFLEVLLCVKSSTLKFAQSCLEIFFVA